MTLAAALTGRSWTRLSRCVSIALVSILLAIASVLGATPASAAWVPFIATLGTNPYHAAAESAAGVKVAMMELNWAKYEPQQGKFNLAYQKEMQTRLKLLRASGMKVTLGLGLHYTPGWVLSKPNSRFVDQYGTRSATVNLVFNDSIRALAKGFLVQANAALHFSSFWAVRVTSGGASEVLYPGGGHYWAFDVNAQNGSAMPKSMARNPFKGWKPGHTGLTGTQMTSWAQWYVGALADTVRWQALTVQHLGFTGYVQVITPGLGVQPSRMAGLVKNHLPNGTLGAGAAWAILYSKLTAIPHVVAYLSSVGDGSGHNVGCFATDRNVALTSTTTASWSSTRWLARVATQYGFAKAGENPGLPSSAAGRAFYLDPSSKGMMATVMALSHSCGYQGVYWAHDDQLWNGTTSLNRFAAYV